MDWIGLSEVGRIEAAEERVQLIRRGSLWWKFVRDKWLQFSIKVKCIVFVYFQKPH